MSWTIMRPLPPLKPQRPGSPSARPIFFIATVTTNSNAGPLWCTAAGRQAAVHQRGPSPQTRTLDLFGALRPGDRRRDKQLLPEDGPSEDNTLIPFSFVLPAGNGLASCSVQCGG